MPLDQRLKALMDQMAGQGAVSMDAVTPQQMREQYEGMRMMDGTPEEVASVEDRTIPAADLQLPVRIYTPAGPSSKPVIVFFHGGGWVIGSLNTHDGRARALANATGSVVVSVDYRLAPEHKFPCAAEDAYCAAKWASDNAASLGADPSRLALCGDSAGGNLTAAVALMARDRGGPPIAAQVMIYPVTSYGVDMPSYSDNGQGYMLTNDSMRWFWGHYLRDSSDGQNPYAAPLRAESLQGLPPAVVLTAEFDPLRDEGAAYAKRLEEAGVPVTYKCYDGMMHGFFQMTAMVGDVVQDAIDLITGELKKTLSRASV